MSGRSVAVGIIVIALGACTPAEQDAGPSEAPEGYQQVTVTAAQVSFAAPVGWSDISPEDLDGAAADVLARTAEAVGISEDDLHGNARAVDMFLIDPDSPDAAEPQNIVVNHEPAEAVEELPTEQEVAALFESYGLDGTEYQERTSPAGDTVYGLAESPTERPGEYMGMAFGLNDEGDLVVISVAVSDPDRLEDITQTAATTITAD